MLLCLYPDRLPLWFDSFAAIDIGTGVIAFRNIVIDDSVAANFVPGGNYRSFADNSKSGIQNFGIAAVDT